MADFVSLFTCLMKSTSRPTSSLLMEERGDRFPGSDGSAHSTIRSTLPNSKNVVGGTIRLQNGKHITDELGGHYGEN